MTHNDKDVYVTRLRPLFPLGKTFATPGALAALEQADKSAAEYFARHHGGDWGDLSDEDKDANEYALISGERILSAYRLSDEVKIWIITEADRSASTILLPDEY